MTTGDPIIVALIQNLHAQKHEVEVKLGRALTLFQKASADLGESKEKIRELEHTVSTLTDALCKAENDLIDSMRQAKALRAELAQANEQLAHRADPQQHHCPGCGPGMASDEDGCCTACGADLCQFCDGYIQERDKARKQLAERQT